MEWLEIAVTCPPASEEAVCEMLRAATGTGVALEPSDAREPCATKVRVWLPVEDASLALANSLRRGLMVLPDFGLPPIADFSVRTVEDSEWLNEWKQHQQPIEVGRRLRVLPARTLEQHARGRVSVFIEPGMAFGTGSHPTTRLTLEYLDRLVRGGQRVADVGTGSGILAIAALKLGASEVWASESDSLPRRIAAENARRNGVGERVHVLDPERFERECPRCHLVVCNIVAETIISLSQTLSRITMPGGLLVASGIVAERLYRVTSALRAYGMQPVEVASDGVWRTLLIRQPQEADR